MRQHVDLTALLPVISSVMSSSSSHAAPQHATRPSLPKARRSFMLLIEVKVPGKSQCKHRLDLESLSVAYTIRGKVSYL